MHCNLFAIWALWFVKKVDNEEDNMFPKSQMMISFLYLSIFSGFGTPGDLTERHLVQERFLSQPGGPHFSRAAAQSRPGPSVPEKGEKHERSHSFQVPVT